MKVDGKAIAAAILDEVRADIAKLGEPPLLTAFTCEPTFETELFLKRKRLVTESVGARLRVIEFDRETFTEEVILSIRHALSSTDGVIVQLPFPNRIDMTPVLSVVPPTHDVDALTYDGTDNKVLPPVVGAIKAILDHHDISLNGKNVVVVGRGRLVGAPAAIWARTQGGQVTMLEKSSASFSALQQAEVVILGAGMPGLITPDMLKPGVVVLDAGTSEESGVLKGDADPAVAEVASLFTPVPGGIGPITIAVLLRNLVELTKQH